MDADVSDGDELTHEQRNSIAELARASSRSPVAPAVFTLVAGEFVAAASAGSTSRGYLTQAEILRRLNSPYKPQAISKQVPRWVSLGLVEIGALGLRAGPRIRSILKPEAAKPETERNANVGARPPSNATTFTRAASRHPDVLVTSLVDIFVGYASLRYNMRRSAALGRLLSWRGSRDELADCLCGLFASMDAGCFPEDIFLALEDVRVGVGSISAVDAQVYVLLKHKQIEAQRTEALIQSRASAAFNSFFMQSVAQVLAAHQALQQSNHGDPTPQAIQDQVPDHAGQDVAGDNGQIAAHDASQSSLNDDTEPPALQLFPSGAPVTPSREVWGQPRPDGSPPAG